MPLMQSLDAFRIIPAYAGLTRRLIRVRKHRPDHPRLRGVNAAADRVVLTAPGSSPLTRG